MGIFGIFSKKKKESLDKGLDKTRRGLFDRLVRAIGSKSDLGFGRNVAQI